MTPRRILLTADAVGGVWQYTCALARALEDRGIGCVVAVLGDGLDDNRRRDAAGLAIIETGLALDWLAESPAVMEAACRDLRRLAADCGADSVHLHSPAYAAGGGFDVPCVAVAHSCVGTWWRVVRGLGMTDDVRWRAAWTARGLADADAVIAPTVAFTELLRSTYARAGDVKTIHHGLHVDLWEGVARQDYVLTAGRLWDSGKNMATLDRAAGMAACRVLAAGSLRGFNGDALRPIHLQSLGSVSGAAMGRLQSEAAVFAATSVYEPFGLAVLEAALRGTPLLLADIPTFRELWDGAAMFVPPRSESGWARAMLDLLADRARRDHLGALARARAAQYTVEAMVDATLLVHERARTPEAALC